MGKKKQILIVDDEPNVRRLVSNILKKDYTVLTAADGKEAISVAHRKHPDIILMDIMMPEMDGYSACHALKCDEATSTIPVVIITALGQELNKKFAHKVGADAYLTKPFSVQDLREIIDRFVNCAD